MRALKGVLIIFMAIATTSCASRQKYVTEEELLTFRQQVDFWYEKTEAEIKILSNMIKTVGDATIETVGMVSEDRKDKKIEEKIKFEGVYRDSLRR